MNDLQDEYSPIASVNPYAYIDAERQEIEALRKEVMALRKLVYLIAESQTFILRSTNKSSF